MRSAIVLALLLSACATTPEGIALEPVSATYTSNRAPMEIAGCLKTVMPIADIFPLGEEVSVSIRNQFDSILLNWRIRPTESGSTIELRKTSSLTPGEARATRCF